MSRRVEEPRESSERIRQIRARYLFAMGVALGANPLTVSMSTDALLQQSSVLSTIDISKGANDPDADTAAIRQISAIGSWFLNGSAQQNNLKFTVGARVLALLREDPSSGYFTNLAPWIQRWTDGGDSESAVATFKELIK